MAWSFCFPVTDTLLRLSIRNRDRRIVWRAAAATVHATNIQMLQQRRQRGAVPGEKPMGQERDKDEELNRKRQGKMREREREGVRERGENRREGGERNGERGGRERRRVMWRGERDR